jgi:hypothetical protein
MMMILPLLSGFFVDSCPLFVCFEDCLTSFGKLKVEWPELQGVDGARGLARLRRVIYGLGLRQQKGLLIAKLLKCLENNSEITQQTIQRYCNVI